MKDKFHPPTILAVDDNPRNLQVFGSLLKDGLAVFELDNECSIDKLLWIADDKRYKQKKLKKEAGSIQESSLSTVNKGG